GQRRAATGSVGSQLALVQLDEVFRLATLAIQRVVEPFGAATRDVGHHVADIQAIAGCLDARSDAPLAFPGFGAVAGFGIAPHHRRLPPAASPPAWRPGTSSAATSTCRSSTSLPPRPKI